MKFLSLGFLTVLLLSCQKTQVEKHAAIETSDSLAENAVTPINELKSHQCYLNVTGRDSLVLKYENNQGTVIGTMAFKNFQKDSSFGDVKGNFSGDTLKLNYTFQSEGTTSVREVIFLNQNNTLIERTGPLDETGPKFSDYSKITFEGNRELKPVDCQVLN